MPKVSVVIPAFNCGNYLEECMESVLGQSYEDIELVLIDDGSYDNTGELVKAYLGDSRVRYIRKPERKGLPAARNTGVEVANGDLIAFLDADDVFLPRKIQKQVDAFAERGFFGISYTNQFYFTENPEKEVISNRYHFSGDVFYYLKRSNFIPASTVMAKREIFRENKFNEFLKSHEDWELYLRLALNGTCFTYMEEPLSKIRVRQGSMSVNEGIMEGTRREVGLRAKAYWLEFKRSMNPFSAKGQKAILRYVKLKGRALLIGFPRGRRFNRALPQELL